MSAATLSDARLGSRQLLFARLAWFLILGAGVGLDLLGLSRQFTQWETLCRGASCTFGQLTPAQGEELQRLGLSLQFWATYLTLNWIFPQLAFLLIGAVILWFKAQDRMAFLASFMLMSLGVGSALDVQSTWPLLRFLNLVYQAIGNLGLELFILLFPVGRFVPGWTRWLVPVFIAKEVYGVFNPGTDVINGLFLFLILAPVGVALQWYRYRRVSNAVQRQQTKWVVFGMATALFGIAGMGLFITSIYPIGISSIPVALVDITAITLFLLVIPLSFGVAILRARLWDIDLLIRRTLIYGILTLGLALFYFTSVILLGALRAWVFESILRRPLPEIGTIISTLGTVVLFVPLRRRVQNVIDRRFYRRKYDAQKILAAFGATVRDEVELDRLTGQLLGVVQETMQPAHCSLWLRSREDAWQGQSDRRDV